MPCCKPALDQRRDFSLHGQGDNSWISDQRSTTEKKKNIKISQLQLQPPCAGEVKLKGRKFQNAHPMTYFISEIHLTQPEKNNSRIQVSSSSLGFPHPHCFILLLTFPWRRNEQGHGQRSLPVPSRGHSGITQRQEQGQGQHSHPASPVPWLELHGHLFIPQPGAPGVWTLLPARREFPEAIRSQSIWDKRFWLRGRSWILTTARALPRKG